MRRNRVVGLALLGLCVLAAAVVATLAVHGTEPEDELLAVPASIPTAPEPERDGSKTLAVKVDVPAPNGDDRPWVI